MTAGLAGRFLGLVMESGARESSDSTGSGLIPMRFLWLYGGRSVFVSGSFNRLGLNAEVFVAKQCIICSWNIVFDAQDSKFLVMGRGFDLILRWSRLLPMSPVEGCPTVFQTICSIPPGGHQVRLRQQVD